MHFLFSSGSLEKPAWTFDASTVFGSLPTMPPKGGSLLFINKSAGSSSLSNSRSERGSARNINQHVQRTRDLDRERKARRERKKAALLREALPTPPSEASPGTAPGTSGTQSLPTPPESPDDLVLVATSSQGRHSPEDYDVEEIVRPSGLDMMIPARGSVEPFDVVKVPLDNANYHILQYFVLQFFPAVTRSDTHGFISGDASASQLPALRMVHDALSHPMHTYALLTGASARMKHVTKAEFANTDVTERFAEQAIRMLREYMEAGNEIDDKLLQSMYYLWATESYRRNWDGVRAHQEMVKHLYQSYLGGFRNLNVNLRKMLWFADRFQASATAKPPIIEESWQPEDISPETFETISKAIKKVGKVQMGSAFPAYSSYFSEKFKQHLHEVIELASVIQVSWMHMSVQVPDRDWVIGRSYTLSDQLLYFKDSRQDDPFSLPIVLQDCVRLAVIVWLAFIPSPRTGVSPTSSTDVPIRVAVDARPLRYRFATLLGFGKQDIGAHQNDIDKLFLWIAGVGALASELEENQQWFCQHFGRLAKKLNINSWSAFAPIDRSFLWLDRLESVSDSRLTLLLLTQAFD